MIKKTIIVFLPSLILLVAGASVSASSPFDIEFPIAELGGCADKAACAAYCDGAANGVSCAEFAARYGLGDKRSVEAAKTIQQGGPGGCASEESCHAYCEDPSHETECVEFAVSKGFMTRAEADRAQKPGPGGCRGRACQQYCKDPAHEEECFEFGVKNGFIPKEEAQRIREFKKKFGAGQEGPGGCQGEEQCRAYCNDPSHIDACVAFAEDHGFVDKEQARIIKKTHGTGPGGCKGDACRAYCEDPSHQNECIDFAAENGLMKPEEVARARKFAGKTGPGGCRGDQCRDFCNQQGNEEQCLDFAEREGIIPKEELARAKKFMAASRDGGPGGCRGVQCRDFCEDPAHREECFGFAKKQGLISKEEEKHFEAGSKIQDVVKKSGGPGGCKNDDECRAYCTDPSHVEECIAFGAAHGGVPPDQVRAMLKQFMDRRFEVRGGGDFGPQGFGGFQEFEQDSNRRFEEFRALEEQFRGQEFPGFGPPAQDGFPGGGFPGGPPGGFPGQGGEFPGRPGEFPGGPGGNAGGSSFAGPGGCSSPAECIKYCTEHREECFGGPPQGNGSTDGQQNNRGGQSDFGGGDHRDGSFGPPPQLRGGLIRQFDQGELPEGFGQLPQEEREKLFHDKFPQFNPPSPGQFSDRERGESREGSAPFPDQQGGFPGRGPDEFPGRPPQGFPGMPGDFPGAPDEFPSNAPQGFPGGQEGFHPPEGGSFPRPPENGSFPRPPEGAFRPPEGTFNHPPPADSGTFNQPPSGSFPQPPPPSSGGTFVPPPSTSGSFSPPPSDSGSFSAPPPPSGSPPPPPPSGRNPILKALGSILNSFIR